MISYFDASALVKRYVDESGSKLVKEWLQRGACATSRISEVEVASALTRRWREKKSLSEPTLKELEHLKHLERALGGLSEDFGGLEVVELSPTSAVFLGKPRKIGDLSELFVTTLGGLPPRPVTRS